MWVKGSGSDLATMEGERLHAAAARRDARRCSSATRCATRTWSPTSRAARSTRRRRAPRSRRCCTRSSRRRTCTTRIPTASTCWPGTRDGERLVAECFGDEAAWIPYIRPGFTLAKQVGTAVRENPQLKLVVLAKHGLVVWGDTAEEAYRRTIEVINRAVEFVNARTSGEAALRRRGRRPPDARAPRRAAARRAARAARRGVERAPQGAGRRHARRRRRSSSPRARRRSSDRGRCGLPRPSRPHQADPAVDPVRPGTRRRGRAGAADRRARAGVPRRLPRLRGRARRRRRPSRPIPTRGSW